MSLELIHTSFRLIVEGALPELPVTFENESYTPKLAQDFGVFQLGTVSTERLTQGKCAKLSYNGEGTLTVKVPIKQGAASAYSYADRVIEYIMANGSNHGFKIIDTPFVADSVQEGDWFTLPILIPFNKDS